MFFFFLSIFNSVTTTCLLGDRRAKKEEKQIQIRNFEHTVYYGKRAKTVFFLFFTFKKRSAIWLLINLTRIFSFLTVRLSINDFILVLTTASFGSTFYLYPLPLKAWRRKWTTFFTTTLFTSRLTQPDSTCWADSWPLIQVNGSPLKRRWPTGTWRPTMTPPTSQWPRSPSPSKWNLTNCPPGTFLEK